MKTIKDQVDYYRSRILYWNNMLEGVRETCPHENVDAKYDANTGNWCEQDNAYWVTVSCRDCGKWFTVDSNEDKEGYKYWGGKVK